MVLKMRQAGDAGGGAQAGRPVSPGTAAQDLSRYGPAKIAGRPFPDVTRHIVQAEGVGFFKAHRMRLLIRIIFESGVRILRCVSPVIFCTRASPCRFFPFPLGGKTLA